MFFIFGSPRSGTTLLSSVLDLHSQIVVPDETDFIVPLLLILDRVPDEKLGRILIKQTVISTERFVESLCHYITAADVCEAVDRAPYRAADILDSIYSAIAGSAKKTLAGDKSPNDLMNIRDFQKLGVLGSGSIKIIHIVRDVRDVVSSIRQCGWFERAGTFFPQIWAMSNLNLHLHMHDQTDRYFFIRYEDLVVDPDAYFRRMVDFLGLKFEPAILDDSRRGARYKNVEYHRALNLPIDSRRAHAWKKEMDPGEIQACTDLAREALYRFGYETGSPARILSNDRCQPSSE